MEIDTGGVIVGLDTGADTSGPAVGKHVVLFDPASTFAQSPLIVVRPMTSILLVGYNIPDGAVFVVEGVSVGMRSMAQGYGCCGPVNGVTRSTLRPGNAPDILFRSPMQLGGQKWELTPENDRLLITLPGDYLLTLNDTQYLGDTQVEMMIFPGHQQVPFAYMAGIKAGT